MIKLELVSVRSMVGNVDRFHASDEGIEEYIRKNFKDTGKLVSVTNRLSKDYAIQTKTFIFKSHEDYLEFINDEVLQYQTVLRDRYNTYHNIIFSQTMSEL